jgi:hypothetical protein
MNERRIIARRDAVEGEVHVTDLEWEVVSRFEL